MELCDDEQCQESLGLAKNLFEALHLKYRPKPIGADEAEATDGTIPRSEFGQVFRALRDHADGACGILSVESTPSNSPAAAGKAGGIDGECHGSAMLGQEGGVDCDEFVGAMHEVYGIVGRRTFNTFMRLEMRKAGHVAGPASSLARGPRGPAQAEERRADSAGDCSLGSTHVPSEAKPLEAQPLPHQEAKPLPHQDGQLLRRPSELEHVDGLVSPGSAAHVGVRGRDGQGSEVGIGGCPQGRLGGPPQPLLQLSPPSAGEGRLSWLSPLHVEPTPASTSLPKVGPDEDDPSQGAPPWDPTSSPNSGTTVSNSAERRFSRDKNMLALLRMDELHELRFASTLPPTPVAASDFSRLLSEPSPISRRFETTAPPSFLTTPREPAAAGPPLPPAGADSVPGLPSSDDVSSAAALQLPPPAASEAPGVDPADRNSVVTVLSHLHCWNLPEETLFIFDWDDTLCPTTFIKEDDRLAWDQQAPCFQDLSVPLLALESGPQSVAEDGCGQDASPSAALHQEACAVSMAEAFRRHSEVVASVLRTAAACGHVAIVTLARQGWVETSIKNFLPALQDVMNELSIDIVYARRSLPQWKIRHAVLDGLDVFQLMKQAAMKKCIRKVYSSRPQQSWKNIISIGDSPTEHDALLEVVYCRPQQLDFQNDEKICRCKMAKLHEEPDLTQLTAELEMLLPWLQPIASFDGDIDLDLGSAESSMAELERVLGMPRLSPTSSGAPAANDWPSLGRVSLRGDSR